MDLRKSTKLPADKVELRKSRSRQILQWHAAGLSAQEIVVKVGLGYERTRQLLREAEKRQRHA